MGIDVGTARAAVARWLERASALQPPPRGITLSWHDRISDEVAHQYAACGGEQWLPFGLFKAVFENPSGHRKTIALLTRDGAPWAVVPLRLAGLYWEPLFVGVIPEILPFPCAGDRAGVLAALRLNVGTWACIESPAGFENLRWATSYPSYEVDLRSDPVPYWRKRDIWKTIKQAVHRCEPLELVENDAYGCDWMFRGWRDRFYTGKPNEVSSKWSDRTAVARWSFENGWRMRSWHLRDGERWVGGLAGFVNGDCFSVGTVYRDPEYDWFGVGHRLFYESFMWARSEGFPVASLGASMDYKRRWAQNRGKQWSYVVAPLPVHGWNGSIETAGRLAGRLRARATSDNPFVTRRSLWRPL